jgi:DNA transposition AAA+ family ATPase
MCRSLHDLAGIGLAMCGNQSVYQNIYRGGNNGFAQIFSRLGKRVILSRPMSEDVRVIAAALGITGKPELGLLTEISKAGGALRSVVKTVRLAATYSQGQPITVAHLAAAHRDLQGSEREVANA